MSCSSTTHNQVAVRLAARLYPEFTRTQMESMMHRLRREAREFGMESEPAETRDVLEWAQRATVTAEMLPMGPRMEERRRQQVGQVLRGHADARRRFVERVVADGLRDERLLSQQDLHAMEHLETLCESEVGRGDAGGQALTVAVDCDGVLYGFREPMYSYVAAKGHRLPDVPQQSYDMSGYLGMRPEQFDAYLREGAREGELYRYGEQYEDAAGVVRQLYGEGHRVHVVTARNTPGMSEDEVRRTGRLSLMWLRENRIPFDRLVLTQEKESEEFDVLLDDSPVNVSRAAAAGRNAVLVAREWNESDVVEGESVGWGRMPMGDALAAVRARMLR